MRVGKMLTNTFERTFGRGSGGGKMRGLEACLFVKCKNTSLQLLFLKGSGATHAFERFRQSSV